MGVDQLIAELGRASPEQPVRLGRYEVTGTIGRGGMGTVYAAIDRDHSTRVAVKTLRRMDPDSLLRLKNEFRSVTDVSHPNLVPVYELACHEGLWFFTMALVDGVNIIEWLRGEAATSIPTGPPTVVASPRGVRAARDREQTGDDVRESTPIPSAPPAIDRVRAVLTQLIAGVHALHRAGLLHLDLKPSNVLVDSSGVVHVLDFGLTRSVDDQRTSAAGADAISISGTPMWMAPEQFTNANIGKPADWYAVGLMLYMSLTGVPAYPEGTTAEMGHARQLVEPTPPRDRVPELPLDLSELAVALLQADPSARPSGETLFELTSSREEYSTARQRHFVGRQSELNVLREAYRRAAEGQGMLVQVIGTSGLGKSALLRRFLRDVRATDAIALQARCYERETVPYKGFDGLLDQLAAALAETPGDLAARLPRWIRELVRVFPVLHTVPSIQTHLDGLPVTGESMSVLELRRRAVEAVRELFTNLAARAPLVLEIDDLQWADADSATLLHRLLTPVPAGVLLVVSFRPHEAQSNPALAPYLSAIETLDADLRTLLLDPLPRAEARDLAALTLESLDHPADSADAIADESAGVPFFVEELAHYVATSNDSEEPPAPRHLSLDTVLRARVQSLPDDQRTLVEVLSVANNPIPLAVAFEQAALHDGALRALWGLRSNHFVRTTGATTTDVVELHHDRLRESVFEGLDAERIDDIHLGLGRSLARDDLAETWRFDAVRHLNCVHDQLTTGERLPVARLNLETGQRARRGAAFPLAFDCFSAGVALLDDGAWKTDYELALGLHAGAAEAAYLCSAWEHLDSYVHAVKTNARTVLDQLAGWETEIDACIARNEYGGAIDTAVEVLGLLGAALPADPNEAEVGVAVQAAMAKLAEVSPDALAALPVVDDPSVAAAMRIQCRITSAAYFGRPMLLPVLAARLVETSVERGVSPVTPYALSVFGIVLNTLGMHEQAHTWGTVALELLDRFEDRSLEARTRHVANNLVCNWMVHLDSTLDGSREVVDIGKATGDPEYAAYSAHAYVHNAIYAGRELESLYAVALEYGEFMRGHRQVNALHVHEPFEQMLRCYLGLADDPARLDGGAFTEDAALEAATASGSRAAQCLIRCVMGMVRYHFGSAEGAARVFEDARPFLDGMPSVWHVPMFHQYSALSILGLVEADREPLRDKAEASLAELERLADLCPVNFAHRVELVRGEMARADGNAADALDHLARALALATTHRWPNDVGLVNERLADLTGDAGYAEAARAAYQRWGARAKLVKPPR